MRQIVVFCVLVLALPGLFAQTQWRVTGYTQARLTAGEHAATSWETPQTEVNVFAVVSPQISARIQARSMPSARLTQAYAEFLPRTAVTLRSGLLGIPVGYEANLARDKMVTLEPSKVTSAIIGPVHKDRGVLVLWNGGDRTVSAGLVNGEGLDPVTNANNHQAIVGRISTRADGFVLGLSGYVSTKSPPVRGLECSVVEIYGPLTIKGILLNTAGEYLNGRKDGAPVDGWYLLVSSGVKTQVYLRYDTFDPDTGKAGNEFARWTVGAGRRLGGMGAKVSVEVEDVRDRAAPRAGTRATMQYQVSF